MGGEPKVDGRSTEPRSNTSGRTVEHQPNTNRTPVGDQWESIEGQWEVNGRKIGKNVKKREDRQRKKSKGQVMILRGNQSPFDS